MSGTGSGRAGGSHQFANRVVDGAKTTDERPTTQRKHWPKPDDAVERWLTAERDAMNAGSPEWWTIQGILVKYRATANKLTFLGNEAK